MFPNEGPDPVVRPPFQIVPTWTRIDYPPGACPPQPDDVAQTVLDAGTAAQADAEAANDSSMFSPDMLTPP